MRLQTRFLHEMIIFAAMEGFRIPDIPIAWQLFIFSFFCLFVLIQIFYYLYLFRRLAYYVPPQKAASQEYPVSVIICAKDEAENIANNLPGVLVQQYKTTHEVIMVNDNSTDESKYLLEELQRMFKQLNTIPLKQEAIMIPGKKFPLSVGIKSAKHEVLLLTDADCLPASDLWIQKMQEGYNENIEIVLGYGAFKKKPGMLNKLIRFEGFHTAMQYFSYTLAGRAYMGVGRNLSYKRDLFIRSKGFSSIYQVPGGDDDLFINMVADEKNTAIIIDKDAFTITEPQTTWKAWRKQKFRHYTTSKYYKPEHKSWLGLYSLSHSMMYVMLLVSAVMFNWWLTLSVMALKYLIQGIIMNRCMKKLNEGDLVPYFIFLDIWMFFYHLLFVPALWRRPAKTWK